MKLYNLFFLVIFLLSSVGSTFVYSEVGQAFIVTIEDKKVKVISPLKRLKKMSLIVKNNTLVTVHGKIRYESVVNQQFFNISSLKSKSISLNTSGNGRIFFVPLSPPSQDIELKFGNKTYEIPPK